MKLLPPMHLDRLALRDAASALAKLRAAPDSITDPLRAAIAYRIAECRKAGQTWDEISAVLEPFQSDGPNVP